MAWRLLKQWAMKNTRKSQRKLQLNAHTLRNLSTTELGNAAGAQPITSFISALMQCTRYGCPISYSCLVDETCY
jgi:hypothetical protein